MLRKIAVLLCASALSGNAIAQDAPVAPTPVVEAQNQSLSPRQEGDKAIYDAAQFARFSPQTANDMVGQIPGFSITQTSNERGLGEASQNVLINGSRIASKGEDAEATLARISAKSVLRLEIVDASKLNIAGLTGQVLNVVTKPANMSGNFNWRPLYRSRLDPLILTGAVSLSGKLGKGQFSLGLNAEDSFAGGGWGDESNLDGNRQPIFTRSFNSVNRGDSPKLSASYSQKANNGSAFNISGSAQIFNFRGHVDLLRKTPGQVDLAETSINSEKEWNYELSSDYEFPLGGGKLKLIGYQRFEHSPSKSSFERQNVGGAIISGSRFNQVVDEGESVLRTEFRWQGGKNEWGVSLEGARNFLDAESEFFSRDSNGIYQPIPLPGATSRVEEKRGQLIFSFGRPLSSKLSLQTTLGGEYSQLSQSGAAGLTRSFWRPKGSINLGWKASSKLDASLRFQRKVGQLNFYDFLASVDLQNNNNNGSNNELVPPQSWLGELEVNRSLGKAGSIKLSLAAEHISDIVDQIPISATEEAPGNLPSANALAASIKASWLLETIGFNGAKLDLDGTIARSWVADPLTGVTRGVNQNTLYSYSVSFRHDIPGSPWTWGFGAEQNLNSPFYRLNYVYEERSSAPFLRIYVEHKNVFGMKLRAVWGNVLGQKIYNDEIFYTARRDGPVERYANSIAEFKNIFRLVLSGTF